MNEYYIRISTYGTNTPHIVDLAAIEGMNYLDAENFMFHCEAKNMEEAEKIYWEEFSRLAFDMQAERMHP